MKISIVIISYNTKKLTGDCVKSIVEGTKGTKYEIIVVDNNSTDGSTETLKKLQNSKTPKLQLKLIENQTNLGFGRANNQGIKKAKGRYVLFLNSDTVVNDNVIGEMVEWMDENKDIGIASCALRNRDGSLQGTGGHFPTLARVFTWMTIQDIPFVDKLIKPFHPMKEKSFVKGESFYEKEKEIDWITGAFFLMRKEVSKQVGGFDEDYFMYTEEVDLCYRSKKVGWKIYYNPKWSITHLGGASGKKWSFVTREFDGVKLFYKKHYPKWQYPVLRLFLKTGAFWRMFLFGLLKGKGAAKAYAKAFFKA